MKKENGSPQVKRSWYIIFFAFVGSIGVYGLLGFLLQQQRSVPASEQALGSIRPVMYGLAAICLLASFFWAWAKMRVDLERVGEGSILSPSEYQTATILALALAEVCSLLGLTLFFLGASLEEFARFAGANLAVCVFCFLPLGNRYWAAWEKIQSEKDA